MKKVFLAVVMLVGLTTLAQEKAPRKADRLTIEERVTLQAAKLTKDLDLNEKQSKDVKALLTKEVEKREAKRAEMKEKKAEMNAQKREEMRASMEKEQAAFSAEMKKILTPEQFAKLEKIREEKKARVQERMMQRREGKAQDKTPESVKPE